MESNDIQNDEIKLCERCKVQRADYQCNQCFLNGLFCSSCDMYLHSLPSKQNHKRIIINPLQTEESNQNVKSVYSLDINNINKSLNIPQHIQNNSSKYCEDELTGSQYINKYNKNNSISEKENLNFEMNNQKDELHNLSHENSSSNLNKDNLYIKSGENSFIHHDPSNNADNIKNDYERVNNNIQNYNDNLNQKENLNYSNNNKNNGEEVFQNSINNNNSLNNSNQNITSQNNLNIQNSQNSPISHFTSSNINQEFEPNQTSPIRPSSSIDNLVNKIKFIYENEKSSLQNRVDELTDELKDTKLILNENIDTLHKNLDDANIKYKNEICEINNSNISSTQNLIKSKDEEIQNLLEELHQKNDELEHQGNINLELINKLNEYKQTILARNAEYEQIVSEKINKIKQFEEEFKTQDDFYLQKIEEINNNNVNEKDKIVKSYENTISELESYYEKMTRQFEDQAKETEEYIYSIKSQNHLDVDTLKTNLRELKETKILQKSQLDNLIKNNDALYNSIKVAEKDKSVIEKELSEHQKDNAELTNKLKDKNKTKSKLKTSYNNKHSRYYGNVRGLKDQGKRPMRRKDDD